MYRVFLVMVAVLCAEASIIGEAFFCRDPDTGKLHAINTTWRSTSFCGNFHCRLRRKNLTHNQYGPLRQINITNVNLGFKIDQIKNLLNTSKTSFKKEHIDVQRINDMLRQDINPVTNEDPILQSRPILNDGDRYLSEEEIELITAILHTVKKSDIDAVIDIFNLAQDIYKEIESSPPDKLRQDAIEVKKQEIVSSPPKANKIERVSYWYEPINNNKQRDFVANSSKLDGIRSSSTITYTNTTIPTQHTIKTQYTPTTIKPLQTFKTRPDKTYFNKAGKDLKSLPYYYSLSNYQRQPSYVHTPVEAIYINPTIKTEKPRVEVAKYQKDIKPSVYLPYPFSHIHHNNNNWTHPQKIYMKNQVNRVNSKKGLKTEPMADKKNKIKYVNSETKDKSTIRHLENEKKNKVEDKNVDNVVLVNPDLENYHESDLKTEDDDKDEKELMRLNLEKRVEDVFDRDWQTDPISKQILEDARAHIEKTIFLKPLFSRKKIKLERVGKVLQLDELNMRKKRTASRYEPELYEVYIEKTTCITDDSIPGYFRYGNISEPYPECCPQRIL